MKKKILIIAAVAVFAAVIISALVFAVRNPNGVLSPYGSENNADIGVRVSVTPDMSMLKEIDDTSAFFFDLGVVTTIKNVIWQNENTAIVISEDNGYIWVFECDLQKKTTLEKSIITLKEGEKYSDSKVIADGRICISTTKNIIFLNDKLAQDRSVRIRCNSGDVKESCVNFDGSQFLFIDDNGLSIAVVGSLRSKILVANGIKGENSVPYKAGFIDNDTLYYHYVAADRTVECDVMNLKKTQSVKCSNVQRISSVTANYISALDSTLSTGLRTVKIFNGKETLYKTNNYVVFAIAGDKDMLYTAGLTANTNKLVIEKIDLVNTTSTTVLALNNEVSGLSNVMFVSDFGKCAVQIDKYDNGNANLLIFDKN